MTPTLADDQIVRMARARAGFKAHAVVYLFVNLFFAAVWFLSSYLAAPDPMAPKVGYYWPAWPHLVWALGLAIHGFFSLGPGGQLQANEEARLRQKFGGGA